MAGQAEIEEIKARLPIEAVVSPYVALQKRGANLVGLCPFHNEKTPSFYVFPHQGTYHCFGCKAHGSIFDFLMGVERISFTEALERLAQRAGVELNRGRSDAADQERRRLREILELVQRFWHDLLLRGERAERVRAYVRERGITPASVETFGLGWAPDGAATTLTWLQERGVELAELEKLGLAKRRDEERGGGHYDQFRNRLIFPIRDHRGNLTGFGGRALDPDARPKYLNSSDSPVFQKGATLYALDQALGAIRDADRVVIVEGYMDALIAHQFGIKNVVASLGTALTERQVGLLKRLTHRIVLALDADAAGSKATLDGLSVIEGVYRAGVVVATPRGRVRQQAAVTADIRILELPDGEDPDEVIRRSPEAWAALVEGALPYVDYYIVQYTRDLDPEDANAKAAAAATILEKIALVPDRVARAHYVARLAARLGIAESVLTAELAQRAGSKQAPARSPAEPAHAGGPAGEPAAQAVPMGGIRRRRPLAERVLMMLLANPDRPVDWSGLEPELFNGTLARQLVETWRDAAAGAALPVEQLRDRTAGVLRDYVDELLAEAAGQPPLPEYAFEREIAAARDRLRKEWITRQMRAIRQTLAGQPADLTLPEVSALMTSQAQTNADLDRLHRAHGHIQDPDYSTVGGERHA